MGAWLAQLVEHMTFDLGVMDVSPILGVEITFETIRIWHRRLLVSCLFVLGMEFMT